jgi:hypothetical protein
MKLAYILMAYTVLTGGMFFAVAQENPKPLLFVGDFERSNRLNALGDTDLEHTLKRVEIVSEPVRHGRRALKLTLPREAPDDPKAHRTDFWIRGMSEAFQMGGEYWYGFSTMLPDDFQPDTLGELFVQWINPGVPGAPSLAIYIYEDSYHIRKRWGQSNAIHKTLWRGSVCNDPGKSFQQIQGGQQIESSENERPIKGGMPLCFGPNLPCLRVAVREPDLCPENKSKRPDPFDAGADLTPNAPTESRSAPGIYFCRDGGCRSLR